MADPKLAASIDSAYESDQAMLADLDAAKRDADFKRTFLTFRERVENERHLRNFTGPATSDMWAERSDAPPIVRRYVAFRRATDASVREMVAKHGWPDRASVGDRAAAEFFFLFGHADDQNRWRLTQVDTLRRVFREDRLNPRLYAHLRDRLNDMAGRPQIFGTIMGPGDAPGSAKLYWPLSGSRAAANRRRRGIGLPPIEADLARFRQGAEIGPYMKPLEPGAAWSLSDVYVGR